MRTVLLTSVSSYFDTPAEIPFMFKQAGCIVDVFCGKNSWLLSNSYYDNWIDAPEDKDSYCNKLIALVQNNTKSYDWVLMMDDETIKLLNEKVDNEELFIKLMPINKLENRELLSSKLGLSVLCNKYNITTPRFINYTSNIDITTINQHLHFPILLKKDFSFSGLGIQYCEDEQTLPSCLAKFNDTTNLVLQEFIVGEDVGLEALFCKGNLVMYNAAKILKYMGNKFSFTTRRLYYQNEKLSILLKHLGASFGLNGFASIQYLYHQQRDTYYLVEVDCRINMWMPYSRFLAQNFSDGIRQYLDNDVPIVTAPASPQKLEITIFDRDMRRCIKQKDIKGLCQWLFNYKGYWRFLPFYDKKLAKRVFGKIFKDLLEKFTKKN
ncbi:MAG: ATP-grasp domain-containing protein [Deinococcales bacterium]|nr:ATP-grasp domain-containing protein [Chitinophagaceae bacterium]